MLQPVRHRPRLPRIEIEAIVVERLGGIVNGPLEVAVVQVELRQRGVRRAPVFRRLRRDVEAVARIDAPAAAQVGLAPDEVGRRVVAVDAERATRQTQRARSITSAQQQRRQVGERRDEVGVAGHRALEVVLGTEVVALAELFLAGEVFPVR